MAADREITPLLIDEQLLEVARQINPNARLTRVKRASRRGPVSWCYWNVAIRARDKGGDSIYGWAIMQWPNRYVLALHHAVWRRPDGELFDVTDPQAADQAATKTLFLPDDSICVSLDRPPVIDNRYFEIVGGLGNPAKKVYLEQQAIRREIAEINWRCGMRGEQCFAKAQGINYTIPPEVLEKLRPIYPHYVMLGRKDAEYANLICRIYAAMAAEDDGR